MSNGSEGAVVIHIGGKNCALHSVDAIGELWLR